MAKLEIPFFTDNCVPDSVGNAILAAGHKLERLRDFMAKESADSVVATTCAQSGRVLVSHDNDFKQIAKRLNITQKQYQYQLHRIDLRCDEPIGAQRISEARSIIEHEWALFSQRRELPMVIQITNVSIRIVR